MCAKNYDYTFFYAQLMNTLTYNHTRYNHVTMNNHVIMNSCHEPLSYIANHTYTHMNKSMLSKHTHTFTHDTTHMYGHVNRFTNMETTYT